jgi:hemerythrin-like domain-containing protein
MQQHSEPASQSAHPASILHEEHARIREVLSAMETQAKALIAGAPLDVDVWHRVVEFLEHFVERLHHEKEERMLFPALECRGFGHDHGPLSALRRDHADGYRICRDLLAALAARNASRLAHVATAFVRRERLHIEREEAMLLPVAMEMLEGEDAARLCAQFEAHRAAIDPLIYERCLTIGPRLQPAGEATAVQA